MIVQLIVKYLSNTCYTGKCDKIMLLYEKVNNSNFRDDITEILKIEMIKWSNLFEERRRVWQL